MSDGRPKAKFGSLWGDLDESKRVAQELEDAARKAREEKTRELRAKRLAHQRPSDGASAKATD